MSTTNSDNKKQKNTNKPQPFLKLFAHMVGYGGFAVLHAVRLPYFTIKKRAAANREINKAKNLKFPLNGQATGELKDMRIGRHTFAHSGCGAIATFNAMAMAGLQPDITEIVDFYEHKGLIMNAALGINPMAVKKYLTGAGLTWKSYRGKQDWSALLEPGKIAIMLYWWVSKNGCGAHYVSMEPCEKGVRVYNFYGNRDVPYEFEDVQTFLESGNYKRVVTMFVIDKSKN